MVEVLEVSLFCAEPTEAVDVLAEGCGVDRLPFSGIGETDPTGAVSMRVKCLCLFACETVIRLRSWLVELVNRAGNVIRDRCHAVCLSGIIDVDAEQ